MAGAESPMAKLYPTFDIMLGYIEKVSDVMARFRMLLGVASLCPQYCVIDISLCLFCFCYAILPSCRGRTGPSLR